jgi:hypothetical protein
MGLHFWRGAIACTGTEFCKLAITETKGFTRWLVDELEERLPGFDQQLKLNVTGCPNSCGQHWVADIGIEGKKIKHEGKLTDAFYFCLGGAVGQHAQLPARSAIAAPPRWFPMPLSGCCATTWLIACPREPARLVWPLFQRRIARAPGRRSAHRLLSAICPPAACRMEWPTEEQVHEHVADLSQTRRPPLPAGWRGQHCAR